MFDCSPTGSIIINFDLLEASTTEQVSLSDAVNALQDAVIDDTLDIVVNGTVLILQEDSFSTDPVFISDSSECK